MELGIYHEFPVLPGRSQAECFAAGFDIVWWQICHHLSSRLRAGAAAAAERRAEKRAGR
jgi:hypothetical protein